MPQTNLKELYDRSFTAPGCGNARFSSVEAWHEFAAEAQDDDSGERCLYVTAAELEVLS